MDQSGILAYNNNYPLKDIPTPHPHDVLCGRGGGTNNHVGNSHWRMLVAANKQLYVTLPKRQKMLLSRSIVNAVRSQNPPGRFLQKDAKSELWYDVGDQRAQEKTSQALREGAPDIRKCLAEKGENSSTEKSTKASTARNKADNVRPPPVPTSSAVPSINGVMETHLASQETLATSNIMQTYMAGQSAMSNQQQQQMNSMVAAMGGAPGPVMPMVGYLPQSAMAGMPMHQHPAMTPDGLLMQSMQNMQNLQNMGQPMAPFFPPPMPAHVPCQKPSNTGQQNGVHMGNNMNSMRNGQSRITGQGAGISQYHHGDRVPQQNTVRFEDTTPLQTTKSAPLPPSGPEPPDKPVSHKSGPVTDDEEVDAFAPGGLEYSGISFGSISMASMNGKLEPAGTSFGSTMEFTVTSKMPEAVDGGLEAIGTSFGSLSLKSDDRAQLQKSLAFQPIPKPQINSFETPPLLSHKKSTGNLLECSDTESEDEAEDAPNQASKSAEWEKLKAMLEQHTNTNMGVNMGGAFAMRQPSFTHQQQAQAQDQLPHTGFDRDFSNISALSMGEFEDDNLSFTSEQRKSLTGFNIADAIAMPPPPPTMPAGDDDDDSITERERLVMMMSAQEAQRY